MANYRGHMEKFERYGMGTMNIMEVNFGATIGNLHDPKGGQFGYHFAGTLPGYLGGRKWEG